MRTDDSRRSFRVAAIALAVVVALLVVAATAPASPTTGVLDDFDRGTENPVSQWGNWAPVGIDGGTPLPVVGNVLENGNSGSAYRTAESAGDAEAFSTVVEPPSSLTAQYLFVGLRDVGTGTYDGCALVLSANGQGGLRLHLRRYDDGAPTELVDPLVAVNVVAGDKLLLRRSGSGLEGWLHSAGSWTLRISSSGCPYSGGRIGVRIVGGLGNNGGSLDDFGGTGFTTPPPPPPPVPANDLLDDFNRTDENPVSQGGMWAPAGVAGGTALRLAGQRLVPSNANTAYRLADFSGDMEAYQSVAQHPANGNGQHLYIALQGAGTSTYDGYALTLSRLAGGFRLSLSRITDGVAAGLGQTELFPGLAGDKMLLRRIGATVEAWFFQSGVWTLELSAPNQTQHGGSGKIGTGFFGGGNPGATDDFGGGALGAAPPPPSGRPPAEQSHGICSGTGVHAIATSRCLSDPVNTLTGAFVTTAEDLSFPSTGVPFSWNRTYTSSNTASGRLGHGWTDSYSTSLEIEPSGDVRLHGDEGQVVGYAKQPDGSFAGVPGARSTLRAVAAGYELERTDQVIYRFDAQGRLLSIVDRNGQGLTLSYDPAGRLESIAGGTRQAVVSHNADGLVSGVSHAGRTVSYGYTDGRLTSLTDVMGEGWRITYDSSGRLATIVDPLGHVQVANVYGASGRVVSQTDAAGKTTSFAWDETTQSATVTDPNGNAWSDTYEDNVLVERSDPLGNTTSFAHDDDLNASAVSSPSDETTSMTHDARGNVLTATAPASLGSARKTFAYNANNDPVRITDARGVVTEYTYDANGNTTNVVQDGRQVAAYTYDSAGRVLTSSDGNDQTTTFAYDAAGNLASETDALGNRTAYTYDDAGRVLTRVDPHGTAPGAVTADFTWRWTYDAAGRVLTERDPLGAITTHTYDEAGNEVTVTDAKGRTTTFEYDAANRLVSEMGPDPDGGGPLPAPVTTSTYDDSGNRRTSTDALGRTTMYAYDAANRLVSTTGPDPDGPGPLMPPVWTTAYDGDGNVASSVEPRGNVPGASPADFRTTFTYDAAGRLLTTTDPLGHATTRAYDAVGNLVSERDANGHTTTFAHDGSGRVVSVTAPDGGVTSYTYDGNGNALTRTDANGHVTSFAYDAGGRLSTETLPDPDGPGPLGPAVTTHAYDANGNLAATVDPNGNATATAGDGRTSFAYDAADRLVRIDYSDSTPAASFAYDAVGNRVSMADGSGTETRTYDALDRLTGVTRGSSTFSYAYDAVGNLARRTYPGGAATVYAYDGLDRMAAATVGGQTTNYAYDAASNLTLTTLPAGNGHVEARSYDRTGRLVDVTTRRGSNVLAALARTLDAVGNPTRIVRTGALAQTQSFTYDESDRLASVCFSAGTCPGAQDSFIRWTYDRVGNRLTEERGGSGADATSYTYDAADRMTRAGSTTFTYDRNGNQLSAGSRTFTYDLANRLRTTRRGSTTTTYSYDGDGVRLQSSTGSSSSSKTNFLWDVNHALPQIALERNGSGSLLRQYAYGEKRISMTSGSSTNYFHHDGLGSVINMTSSSGSRRWTWSYEPFGAIRTEQRSGGSAPTNFLKFAGEYLDPTDLYYLRARHYDPAGGRFLRPDPVDVGVGSPATAEYIYAGNRPTVMVDPSGETFRPSADWRHWLTLAMSHETAREPWPPYVPGRPPRNPRPRLVHPIPRGYSASHGGVHPTGGIPHYVALDFFPGAGAPVLAVQDGTVYRFSGNDPRLGERTLGIFGWSLYLKADSGSDYFYTHLGSRTVSLGRVRAGQVIGRVGRWVRPNGINKSHLHLGVYGGPITIDMVRRAPRVRPR